MVQVVNISPELEPILGFLHPEYSYTEGLTKFRNFITHHDVQSAHEREMLNHLYENAVIISTRIFDALYTPEVMVAEVLEFARRKFRSRKRTLKLQSTDPEAMVRECVDFLFREAEGVESTNIEELFSAYGSKAFFKAFIGFSRALGSRRAIASMETFISKVLVDSQSLYYRRAAQRLSSSLHQNLDSAVAEMRTVDPYFVKHHPDLTALRMYTLLMKKEYYRR